MHQIMPAPTMKADSYYYSGTMNKCKPSKERNDRNDKINYPLIKSK